MLSGQFKVSRSWYGGQVSELACLGGVFRGLGPLSGYTVEALTSPAGDVRWWSMGVALYDNSAR